MMARRRGTTLMEVIALMGGLAVMLAVSIASIQALVSVDRSNRREATNDLRIDRLAAGFRNDVHTARGQTLAGKGGETTLTLDLGDGRSALYVAGAAGVRVERRSRGDAVPRREDFTLPDCRVALEEVPGGAGGPTRLRLAIRRADNTPEDLALWIEAVLGRDCAGFAATRGDEP